MMFYLYYLSQGPNAIAGGFNVFQYVSFRAVCAAITAFLLCLLFGNWLIRKLTSLKFGQPIRTADEVHRLFELHGAKKGTPTMGGWQNCTSASKERRPWVECFSWAR